MVQTHSVHPAQTSRLAGQQEGHRLVRLSSIFSLSVAIILILMKTAAWLATDSLSLLSSLVDSFLDAFASLVTLIAVRYAMKPPDEEHRFGHGRAEDLAALAQAMFISGSGLFILIEGIKRLITPEVIHHGVIGISVMVVSMVLTSCLILFQRYTIRKTGSTAIHADSMHYVMDLLTHAAVIAALILAAIFNQIIFDPILAILIAGVILHGAGKIGFQAFQNLMDREFEDEEREKIIDAITSHPEVEGVHALKTRRAGMQRFIQFHLDLQSDMSLKEAHRIGDQVEEALMALFPDAEVIVHHDPI